ncbi:MAG TPA: 3'(2'),5'-bisphosphate nucleotidase CysQ [Egibacteraceae bacterium]|nr:3'(2'),5'-bisphosphate nucleotidase CysQ [Egibacteraceae bacterium]
MREHQEAARIAHAAGEELLALRRRLDDEAVDLRQLRDDGDRRSHEFIVAALEEAFPGDAVLSEEGKDDSARLSSARVWIVDPLDGTREYGEVGRTDWAVHVAFWADGDLAAGAVALPALGLTLSTAAPSPVPEIAPGRPRLAVSRTRPPAITGLIQEALEAELAPMGSAGAKAMSVVRGEAEVYAHAGGQYEWDSAAPVAVAAACGLHVSRLDGSALAYNQPDPWLPDLLICRPGLAGAVIAAAQAAETIE